MLVIVAFGMFGQLLSVATSDNNFLDPGMNAANKYSMTLLDPVAPPAFHAIWPNINSSLQGLILGDAKKRGSYFIGYTVLAILGYFVFTILKKRKDGGHKMLKLNCTPVSFWISLTAIFYTFSLGPSFSVGNQTVYLPYYLVYKFLPFYENIRTTGRMFVFVLLGACVLFAYGYLELLKRYNKKPLKLALFIGALILLEFWVAPISTMAVSYSSFYDKIAKDTEKYSLIEIPGSTDYEFASYNLFLNTISNKPVLNGMPLARKISKQFAMQQNTPVIKQLLFTIPKGNDPESKDASDILAPFDYAQSNDVLSHYNVRYITISKIYADESVLNLSKNFIEKNISYESKFEDDFLIAYKIKSKIPSGFYAQLDYAKDDLYSADFSEKDGSKWREFGDGASLKIVNMNSAVQNVRVVVNVKGPQGSVLSSPEDAQSGSVTLSGNSEKQYSFDALLKPGDNAASFAIKDSAGLPIKISNSRKNPSGAIISSITVTAK